MSEIVETGSLFTYDEIRVLLYGIGIHKTEGVYMGEKILTKEDIIMTLQGLTERGILTADGPEFVVQKDVRRMAEVMGRPEGTFVWRPAEGNGPEYFCYAVPGTVVVSEPYRWKKDMLKLNLFTTEEFEVWKEQIENDYSGN